MGKFDKILIVLVVIIVIGAGVYAVSNRSQKIAAPVKIEPIKIGIITDLTGPASYWGESTRVGAEIAKKELEQQGYKVDLVFEDYQLDAAKALSAAQKMVNIDNVDAVYAEFNPAAISVNSFIKDKNILFVYDAAVTSPLKDNVNAYKTYLDYQEGCKQVAQKFQEQGIEKIGMLKINMEAGELCQVGVQEVYHDNMISEAYNLGDTDLKTQVLKLKNAKVGAVINAAFEGDTLDALKALQELKFNVPYGTLDDSITANVKNKYGNELKGTVTFGFKDVDESFVRKIQAESTKKLATNYAAAIAYTHLQQMFKDLSSCNKDLICTKNKLDNALSDDTIGFKKFQNHMADLEMLIKQY